MASDNQRNLKHFYFRNRGKKEHFVSPLLGGGEQKIPERDDGHGQKIETALKEALQAAEHQMQSRDSAIEGGTKGFYLEFYLPVKQHAVLDKIEDMRGLQHIKLASVKHPGPDSAQDLAAIVFVPESKKITHLKKVEQYQTEKTRTGKPKNELLVASINDIRLVVHARSLFTDDIALFPATQQQTWWEVWLRDGGRAIFEKASEKLDMLVHDHYIQFPEREVALVRATPVALDQMILSSDAIAELRLARDTPAVFMEMPVSEQSEWTDELVNRIQPPSDEAPAVCVLDSGTTQKHPLIEPALFPADQQAYDATWTSSDIGQWRGHGTQMSGLALYGDLIPHLAGSQQIILTHRLESVKILPDHGANDPELYGHITASAVAKAEVQAPFRKRAFCLAVTNDAGNLRGRPSSWSANLDNLTFDKGVDQRLIVVAAGNIRTFYPLSQYLAQNDTESIESPGQSWNALTVGAITEKCTITDSDYAGWKPFASAGDLSPVSRTSVSWDKDWPLKPDIVMEGGNQGVEPKTNNGDSVDELRLLTTHNKPNQNLFTVSGDTSAATALAARMAAQIYADNAILWPETVRGLIVHSANWTAAMRDHFPSNPRGTENRMLLRRYGYGVPDLERALRSMNSDVTLVLEDELQPFMIADGGVKTCDMVMHELPWPRSVLKQFGEGEVEMRVTLSYFIEPNPGERGWTKRHCYSSHGLRFDVRRAEESPKHFIQRVNGAARDEDYESGIVIGDGWQLGPRLRNRGSIHSDLWRGSAVDLANRGGIAIYPVGGWWREKRDLERVGRSVRYALIVTLKTSTDVNLYAEIAAEISSEAEVDV